MSNAGVVAYALTFRTSNTSQFLFIFDVEKTGLLRRIHEIFRKPTLAKSMCHLN